jgi:hypothetical protein
MKTFSKQPCGVKSDLFWSNVRYIVLVRMDAIPMRAVHLTSSSEVELHMALAGLRCVTW